MVAGGDQDSVHDQHCVLTEPLALLEGKCGAEVVGDAVGGPLRYPEQRRQLPQREAGPPVRANQQNPFLQRQAQGQALADRVRALTPQRGDQLAELTWAQACKRGYPGRLRGSAARSPYPCPAVTGQPLDRVSAPPTYLTRRDGMFPSMHASRAPYI